MLLVIDVGNTNTSMGIYEHERLRASWRLTTRREQTADEWGVFIQTLLGTRGIAQQDITGVAISNVVPPIQQALEWMCDRYFGVNPLTVPIRPSGGHPGAWHRREIPAFFHDTAMQLHYLPCPTRPPCSRH